MKDRKGFTLVELIAVIVILVILMVIAVSMANKHMENSRVHVFLKEANTFSRGAMSKESVDRDVDLARDDIFHNQIYGKVCYSINQKILGNYITKTNNEYKGSVEVCYGLDCTYNTKLWVTDGKHYIDGLSDPSEESQVTGSFSSEYPYSCGVQATGGGTGGDLNTSDFDYTGGEQEFEVLHDGVYSIEAWGAQGGDYSVNRIGGYGSYSYAEVELRQGEVLYVNVGEKGKSACPVDDNTCVVSYNGGSKGGLYIAGGGGATSIAIKSGLLRTVPDSYVYLVAGGGAGGDSAYDGSHAGGYTNEFTDKNKTEWGAMRGKFGNYGGYSNSINNQRGSGGGYSSKSVHDTLYNETNDRWWNVPLGGTGYVFHPNTKNGVMYCYNCPQRYTANTIVEIPFSTSRTIVNPEYSADAKPRVSKLGNGFARITYIEYFTEE